MRIMVNFMLLPKLNVYDELQKEADRSRTNVTCTGKCLLWGLAMADPPYAVLI